MRPSEKTPVERTVDMLRQGLELPTICLCHNVSRRHGEQLVFQAKKLMRKGDETSRLEYRARVLPGQLESARRKVAMLEREAIRIGLRDLVQGGVRS